MCSPERNFSELWTRHFSALVCPKLKSECERGTDQGSCRDSNYISGLVSDTVHTYCIFAHAHVYVP